MCNIAQVQDLVMCNIAQAQDLVMCNIAQEQNLVMCSIAEVQDDKFRSPKSKNFHTDKESECSN